NISWVDEERDTSCWLGNPLQREAFNKLYSVAERVMICADRRIKQDWDYLQASNNLRFMCTKAGYGNFDRGIYDGPYDAFTNYMNVLGDFVTRVNNLYGGAENEEVNSLITTIQNQDDELAAKDKEIEKLQKLLAKYNPVEEPKPAAVSVADTTPEKKTATKKSTTSKSSAKPKSALGAAGKKTPVKKTASKK
nr:alpha-amylase [Bacteroidaceae bacterium]